MSGIGFLLKKLSAGNASIYWILLIITNAPAFLPNFLPNIGMVKSLARSEKKNRIPFRRKPEFFDSFIGWSDLSDLSDIVREKLPATASHPDSAALLRMPSLNAFL